MMLYVDTSALVKNYHIEPGRERVVDYLAQAQMVLISALTELELTTFAERAKLMRKINSPQYRQICAEISKDLKSTLTLLAIDTAVLKLANQAIRTRRLRVQDAIQLGTALVAQRKSPMDIHFLCADHALLDAARAEGLVCLAV